MTPDWVYMCVSGGFALVGVLIGMWVRPRR